MRSAECFELRQRQKLWPILHVLLTFPFFFFRMHAIQTFTKTWLLMNDNWCSLGDVSCCIRIDF